MLYFQFDVSICRSSLLSIIDSGYHVHIINNIVSSSYQLICSLSFKLVWWPGVSLWPLLELDKNQADADSGKVILLGLGLFPSAWDMVLCAFSIEGVNENELSKRKEFKS